MKNIINFIITNAKEFVKDFLTHPVYEQNEFLMHIPKIFKYG